MSLALLLLVSAAPQAHSAPPPETIELIKALFSRPIVRFAMNNTHEGSFILKQITGVRLVGETAEAQLDRLQRALVENDKWESFIKELGPRLNRLETESRLKILESEEAAMVIGEEAAAELAARAGAETVEGASEAIVFVSQSSSGNFAANRARFLEMETVSENWIGKNLSSRDLRSLELLGGDLRLAKFESSDLGDLRDTDLRGASLRGAKISKDSIFTGAVYDQYTSLPFSNQEAAARGMIYEPSTPPSGFAAIDAGAAAARAVKAGDPVPPKAEETVQKTFKKLSQLSPRSVEGVRLFDKPRRLKPRGQEWMQFEAGVIERSSNPVVQSLIEELARYGGELRRFVFANPTTGAIINREKGAYFSFDGHMPTITIGVDSTAPTMLHEREHLRDWMEIYTRFIDQRKTPDEAFKLAQKIRATADYKSMTETNAVKMQLHTQRALDEAAGIPLIERQYRYERRGFSALVAYPDFEALGRIFDGQTLEGIKGDKKLLEQALRFGRSAVRKALLGRRAWFKNLNLDEAAEFTREQLFFEVAGGEPPRFAKDGSLNDIQAFFNSLLPSEIAQLPEDAFKEKVLALKL